MARVPGARKAPSRKTKDEQPSQGYSADSLESAPDAILAYSRQQKASADLGQRALAGTDIPSLMNDIATCVARTLDIEYCHILELLPDGGTFLLRAGFGFAEGEVGRATVPLATAPQAAYTLTVGVPVVCEDLRHETRFTPSQLSVNRGLLSAATVIVTNRGQPYAVLGTHSTSPRVYTADDVHFLQSCATLLTQAMQRKRAEEVQAALLEVAEDTSIGLGLDALLERVQRRAAALLPCDRVVTYRWDAQRQVYRAVSWYGIPDDLVDDTAAGEFFPDEKLVQRLIAGKTVVINDVDKQDWLPGELLAHFRLTSLLLVPLTVRGRTIGALHAINAESGRRFDAHQVELLEGIARQVGVAIEGADLHQAQQEEALLSGALARIGRELIALVDMPLLLQRLCELTVELSGCDSSQTLIRVPHEKEFVLTASYGVPPEELSGLGLVRVERRFLEPVLTALEDEEVTDVNSSEPPRPPSAIAAQQGCGTSLVSPLRRGEQIVGLQTATWSAPGPRTARDKRLLVGLVQMASMALRNAELVGELEQANRVKSEFVATMSHELRTPLNIAMGYTDLVLDEAFGSVAPAQYDILRRVQRSQRQLLDLITSVLDLGRLQGGKLPVQRSDFSLPLLLDELAAALPEKADVRVLWEVPPGLPDLRTDRPKLKLVLRNLVENALKFTERGSVTVRARALEGGVEVCVIDTGVGIAADAQAAIFEPFEQGDASRAQAQAGVGLGLHIARSMLDLLGGALDVESELGRGSTFRVHLFAPAGPA